VCVVLLCCFVAETSFLLRSRALASWLAGWVFLLQCPGQWRTVAALTAWSSEPSAHTLLAILTHVLSNDCSLSRCPHFFFELRPAAGSPAGAATAAAAAAAAAACALRAASLGPFQPAAEQAEHLASVLLLSWELLVERFSRSLQLTWFQTTASRQPTA
jgi:hypothetical protein